MIPMMRARTSHALVCFMFSLVSHVAMAQNMPHECGTLANNYGPYDYRVDKSKLPIVENYHFDGQVEALVRGKSSAGPAGDISYTLRAFPNHHRALLSMIRLAERDKTAKPSGASHSVDCFLVRAEAFRPDDAMVKMLAGIHLMKKGQNREALTKLEAAEKINSSDANLHYNLGLAYFRLNQYDKSLDSAHKAYSMGFTLPGLRNMLKKVGKWQEPNGS